MRYRIHLLLLIGIFLVMGLAGIVQAQPPFSGISASGGLTVDTLLYGTHKVDNGFRLHIHVYNTSNGINMSNNTVRCNVHLYNATGAHVLRSNNLAFDGNGDWELFIAGGNFSTSGSYAVEAWCSNGILGGSNRLFFDVTPSGYSLDQGNNPIIYVVFGMEILFALFFFGLGAVYKNIAARIIFFGLSGIMLIVGLLFSLVLAEQLIPNFTVIIDGLATLWSVIKILTGIFIILLSLFALYLVYWRWNKKRGFSD